MFSRLLLLAVVMLFPSVCIVCASWLAIENHPYWAISLVALTVATLPRWNLPPNKRLDILYPRKADNNE